MCQWCYRLGFGFKLGVNCRGTASKTERVMFDSEHHQIGGGFLVEKQCPFDVAFQVGLRFIVGGQLHHLGGYFEVGRDS